jgi:5'-nucleotidase
MKFLLVNDDGINSERFKLTESILRKKGEVIVFAPMFEQSGRSMAISTREITFEKIDKDHYAVEGTPVDCVNLAIQGFNISPDIVVSGINKGFNLGFDIFYSGTVGACFQANYLGYHTIAFSGSFRGDKTVYNHFERTLDFILTNKLHSQHKVLNVNFPEDGLNENPQIVETEPFYQISRLDGEIKNNIFKFKRLFLDSELPKNSDVYTIKLGNISYNLLDSRITKTI